MNQQPSEARLHALDYWQVIRNRYGVILLSFFLVFMTAAVVTAIMPKKFPGRVLMEIERSSGVTGGDFYDPVSGAKAMLGGMTFLPTEFKIITSKETLSQVVKKRNLVERWKVASLDEAYTKLERMVDASEERGTDLIKIVVLSTDKEEAAELANDVAEAYTNRRKEIESERVQLAFQTLSHTRKGQEQEVERARNKMLELVQELGIVDLEASSPWMFTRGSESTGGKEGLYMQAQQMALQRRDDVNNFKGQLDSIKDKEGEELISAAASMGLLDVKVQAVYNQYLMDERTAVQLENSGLDINHPEVIAIRSGMAVQRTQLNSAVEQLKRNLREKIVLAEKQLENIERLTDEKKEDSIMDRGKYALYQQAKDQYGMAQSILDRMIDEQERARVVNLMPRKPATIHEKATVAVTYSKPNAKLQLGLGALLGLLLGLGFAFFLEYLDTSVKSLDDVERYLGVPVLAVIPKDVGILHKQSGISPDAEAYRILRTNIEFNRKSADANAITVVSGGAGEGKSTTLVNLAYICAQGGYNTLMIDADLRRPKLHTFFDINNSVGLTNYLTTDLQLEDVILQTPIDNLYFMPSGILPADAAGILNSRRMSELIADVKNRFDLVLIDSPPILGVSDASVLASEVDLTMIVIQHRKLPRSMLLRVKQAIENVGGNLLGVVLNNVDVRSDSQYQYYTSYYTYYSPTNADGKTKSRATAKAADAAGKGAGKATTSSKPSKGAPAADDDAY
ncbi:MAG: polysaccharide biosynthesis tyrosine autokinase [Verrucomicrobiales bacterium]